MRALSADSVARRWGCLSAGRRRPAAGCDRRRGYRQTGELVLEPGDTLVAYSDGVLECRSPGDERVRNGPLIAALRGAEQQSAHATLMMLLAAVQDFANGHPLCDDLSLTVIQRDAKGRGKVSSIKASRGILADLTHGADAVNTRGRSDALLRPRLFLLQSA